MSDRKTVLEEGTTLKGTLIATTPVVVMGDLEGDITGPEVEVTESGAITGKVTATTLRSRGRLSGEFEADDVELGGRVADATVVRAKSLAVAPTSAAAPPSATNGNADSSPAAATPTVVFGECELRVGDEPSKSEAIAEALAPPKPRAPTPAADAGIPPSAPANPGDTSPHSDSQA